MTMEGSLCLVLFLTFLSAVQANLSGNYHSTNQCPQPDFLPSFPIPEAKHCVYGSDCNRIECAVKQGPHKLRVIIRINQCEVPWTVTVTIQQPESNLNWSSTLKDGEKAKLAVTPRMFTGGLPVSNASLFIQVGLGIHKDNLNYLVKLVGNLTVSDVVSPVNVILLNGSKPLWMGVCHGEGEKKSGSEDHNWPTKSWRPDKKVPNHWKGLCPPVLLDDGTLCPVTNHCSKITCTAPEEGEWKKLIIQINGCSDPQTATVTIVSSVPDKKWSHTFKNGDKAVPPGGKRANMEVYVKVELIKTNANITFKLTMETGEEGKSNNLNSVKILSAQLPLSKMCGDSRHLQSSSGSTWFSKQPVSVKVVVVFIPVLVVLLVGLGVAFYCYRNSGSGRRFPIHLTPGGSKITMQRLTEDI